MTEATAAATVDPLAAFAGDLPADVPGPAALKPVAGGLVDDQVTDKVLPFAVGSRLDLLRNVEMDVTAQLGSTRMTVRELLSLMPGNIVELNRAAGSPIDLLVNGTLIARGEVVVVDEEFGIRISEIVNPAAGEHL